MCIARTYSIENDEEMLPRLCAHCIILCILKEMKETKMYEKCALLFLAAFELCVCLMCVCMTKGAEEGGETGDPSFLPLSLEGKKNVPLLLLVVLSFSSCQLKREGSFRKLGPI